MQTSIFKYSGSAWQYPEKDAISHTAGVQLALCFDVNKICLQPDLYAIIGQKFPAAQIAICSTSGEICNVAVTEDSMAVTAFHCGYTYIKTASVSLSDFCNRYKAAVALMNELPKEELACTMVLSDGSIVNGSNLVKGLNDAEPASVKISGGFAGNVPEGTKVRFMKARYDKLTAAASVAAGQIISKHKELPAYSLLVSCIGRRLVLGQRVNEEAEAVIKTFGASLSFSGFYSCGEISPFRNGNECHLHNQTITITSFYELA